MVAATGSYGLVSLLGGLPIAIALPVSQSDFTNVKFNKFRGINTLL